MSRRIDTTQPLSEADKQYLQDRGRHTEIPDESAAVLSQLETAISNADKNDLVATCEELGLSTKGKKSDLQDRIRAYLKTHPEEVSTLTVLDASSDEED